MCNVQAGTATEQLETTTRVPETNSKTDATWAKLLGVIVLTAHPTTGLTIRVDAQPPPRLAWPAERKGTLQALRTVATRL